MRIRMQRSFSASQLTVSPWSVGIVGSTVDDRGDAAIDFIKQHASRIIQLAYDPVTLEVVVDGERFPVDDLPDALEIGTDDKIMAEATTLGLVELFCICKSFKDSKYSELSFLYTEPKQYFVRERSHVLKKRDFELSDVVCEFTGLPGAGISVHGGPTRAVFFVGYEGQRLEQALEQVSIRPRDCAVVFGVPAFRPGWEMDSFANNIRVVREQHITELFYAGAQNPAGAYQALNRIRSSCRTGERMLIGPIGTKPHGIGAALFACTHDGTGLMYDHPIRAKGRSKDIAAWHIYSIERSG